MKWNCTLTNKKKKSEIALKVKLLIIIKVRYFSYTRLHTFSHWAHKFLFFSTAFIFVKEITICSIIYENFNYWLVWRVHYKTDVGNCENGNSNTNLRSSFRGKYFNL